MKKQQIAAAACLVAGAIGFAAVYSTQKPGRRDTNRNFTDFVYS